jgi:mannose-1-phosphate guanylyltransferase
MRLNSDEHTYAVIMAGGGGTRLWPLSRQARPKQMLALFDERTLFQTAVDRVIDLYTAERIFVVTVQEQACELQAQCAEIPKENYLIEPAARGTASVIGLAAIALQRRDPRAVMAVLGSDHYISNETEFRRLLYTAGQVAEDDYLVTLGVQPTFPATGFGYIEKGVQVGEYEGQPVFDALKFKEKPNLSQAEAMLAGGNHYWNSGMFIWRTVRILEEIQRQMPELFAGLQAIDQAWDTPEGDTTLQRIWDGLRNETIDYGIMEKARRVVVLPAAGLGWSDVGSWDSLFDLLPGDEHGNIVMGGEHVGLDTAQSLIYVNHPHRLIVTIGVDGLVVVDTGDVLLVCRKEQAQLVRQVVQKLKAEGKDYI